MIEAWSDTQMAALRASGLFDPIWYGRHYGDVIDSGLGAEAHFQQIGGPLGRDPGAGFCAASYLAAHSDVARSGVPALAHYLSSGRVEGRALRPVPAGAPPSRAAHFRRLMQTGGLVSAPEGTLAGMIKGTGPEAALAAEGLAVWSSRRGTPAAAARALSYLDRRFAMQGGAEAWRRLSPLVTIQNHLAGRPPLRDLPDLDENLLALTWADPTPEARIARLNTVLARKGLAPVSLERTRWPRRVAPYDRLRCAVPPAPDGTGDAPLVSVLMAARNAARTLPTALACVTGQSWRALECIVVDDASTDATAKLVSAWAARDPRVRLVQLPQSLGAYGARNRGLAVAKGAYVICHDADDWSHPQAIARQMAALRAAPWNMGCMGLQVRLDEDLRATRWTDTGALIQPNLSALLMPRKPLSETLGGWDTVRISADGEMLRRLERAFGTGAVGIAEDAGVLAFPRDHADSATRSTVGGMDGFYYGVRAEYHAAQCHAHRMLDSLRYRPDGPRPFPAPAAMMPSAEGTIARDSVYIGQMHRSDQSLKDLRDRIAQDREAGRTVGLVPVWSMDMPIGTEQALHPDLRAPIDGDTVRILCHGDRVEAGQVHFWPVGAPAVEPQRYLPHVLSGQKQWIAPA